MDPKIVNMTRGSPSSANSTCDGVSNPESEVLTMSREKGMKTVFQFSYSHDSGRSDTSLIRLHSSASDLESSNDITPITPHKTFPAVVGIILDLLEKRIPSLSKLCIGRRDKNSEEINAISENLKRNSAVGLSFAIQSLSDYSTGVIFEVLRCYIEKNFPALFEPTHNFCKMSVIFHHTMDIHQGDKRWFATEELNNIVKRMPSRRISLLSLIVRRLHIWVQEEIAYQLKGNTLKKSEEIEEEAFSFLADIFSSTLVRISERHEVAIMEHGIKYEDIEVFLKANMHDLEDYGSEMEKYEAENQSPLNLADFFNATQYMRARERQEHYAKIFANLRLARENGQRDQKRAEALRANLKPDDWEFEKTKPTKKTYSPDIIMGDDVDINYKPRACGLTSVKIYDKEGKHMENVCLKKSLEWCSLYTLMTAISVDYWHETALELAKTQQQKEKMRRSKNGSWRRGVSPQRIQ
ncbi:unnamed protein product [Rodentolepis nana]|uniref:FH2 domain-containing protein n=1 Tax=Rodentolepis nana TaxID=102285 RepID=A0A0R3SZY5_RODNA|nr:unnamed protein product [Rodentolepis nana]